MANIDPYLEAILAAVYGEEVRGSIHDAIQAMNLESTEAMSAARTARDSAENYASAAGTSATNAATSATAASHSADDAADSASAAAHSADEAADIVDTGNFVIGVDPHNILRPTSPYLRPDDIINNLTSELTNKPLSAAQGKVLKTAIDDSKILHTTIYKKPVYRNSDFSTRTVTVPAQSKSSLYFNKNDLSYLDDKNLIDVKIGYTYSDSSSAAFGDLMVMSFDSYSTAEEGETYYGLRVDVYNVSSSSVIVMYADLQVTAYKR